MRLRPSIIIQIPVSSDDLRNERGPYSIQVPLHPYKTVQE